MADEDTTTVTSTAEINDDPSVSIAKNNDDSLGNNNLLMLSDHQRRKKFKHSPNSIDHQSKKRATIVRFNNETKTRCKESSRVTLKNTQENTHADNNFLRPTISAVTRSTEGLTNRLHDRSKESLTSPDDADRISDCSNEQKTHVCMIFAPYRKIIKLTFFNQKLTKSHQNLSVLDSDSFGKKFKRTRKGE